MSLKMEVKMQVQMVVCLTVMGVVILSAQSAAAAVSCEQLRGNLASCVGYLRGGAITQVCCNGVRAVANSARTTADRRAACKCLVAAANDLRGVIDFRNAARLPSRCGVTIPFQISPNTNCDRVG